MGFIKAISIFFMGAVCFVAGANAATTVNIKNDPELDKEMFFRSFEMNGHKYIYFMEKGEDGIRQIMHNPDCKCLNKEETNQRLTGPSK